MDTPSAAAGASRVRRESTGPSPASYFAGTERLSPARSASTCCVMPRRARISRTR